MTPLLDAPVVEGRFAGFPLALLSAIQAKAMASVQSPSGAFATEQQSSPHLSLTYLPSRAIRKALCAPPPQTRTLFPTVVSQIF